MKSFSKLPEGHGSVYKEVRFSPTSTPLRRTRSVSGSTPSASSRYQPAINSQISHQQSLVVDTSYIDQSRELLDNQRATFEAERRLFAQERRLWEKERSLLKTKIAELEALLKSQRSLLTNANASAPHLGKSTFGTLPPLAPNDTGLHSAQVWEGSSPGGRPTRVFRDEEIPDNTHLSPIIEGSASNPPSLDAALSPRSRPVDTSGATVSVPVPIEKLDSRLDGITLKSSALPPGVVARVITPPSPSPLETSPAPAPSAPARPDVEHRNSLKLKLSDLGPPNENLVRDAGHTPMAIFEADGSQRSTKEASPLEEPQSQEEIPLAPAATKAHQPIEHAESYFPDLPDDPALKGPLGLTNDEEHDSSFLNELDQKLLDQAKRLLSSSGASVDPSESDPEVSSRGAEEQEPEIKFKNSTNFGTAFGLSSLGKF
ncbi:uncharacterized protein N7459_008319 [Penicillium hispanicum]|uniref:uncharacterized protein n=1 Tax=Penicillium hispanicum TaxID=1080232 RepID=UPI002540E7DD|nr:uncharacterized protein N7459_008319 [Penicillium hispanicum]KAJ5573892.1 hypothetical protein N7459_008319 [Penicillium hispanicum]